MFKEFPKAIKSYDIKSNGISLVSNDVFQLNSIEIVSYKIQNPINLGTWILYYTPIIIDRMNSDRILNLATNTSRLKSIESVCYEN